MRLHLFVLLLVALGGASGAALTEAGMRADRPALVEEAQAAVTPACPVPIALRQRPLGGCA